MPFSPEELDKILIPDPLENRRRAPTPRGDPVDVAAPPAHLTPKLRQLAAEEPGDDRSDQTWKLVLTGLERGLPDEEIVALGLDHPPTVDKYGGRAEAQLDAILDKARPDHNHPGVWCDKAGCPNTPEWMRRGPTEAEIPGAEPDTGRGSWDPVDLRAVLAGEALDPEPSMLLRTDGVPLLYPGKIHSVIAEPEAGKTFLMTAACAERIRVGASVFYFDFESDAATIVERLRAQRLGDDQIADQFHYWRPDDPLGLVERLRLEARLDVVRPPLVVLDGMTEALAIHGYSINDNDHVAAFIKRFPRPLARTGAAVVMIDHLGRDKEGRRGFAIGAQHKKAGVDVVYELEAVKPFGRGLAGMSKLWVRKDRPGHVRPLCPDGNRAGELHIVGDEHGGVVVEVRPALEGSGGAFRPTCLMERISRHLEGLDPADRPSQRQITSVVPGNEAGKRQALECLVKDGYVERLTVSGTKQHRSIRHYRELEDRPQSGSES